MHLVGRHWLTILAVMCAAGACKKGPPPTIAAKRAAEAAAPIDADKTQLVVVVSNQWDTFRATLHRYERAPGQRWKPACRPVDVVLGRNGYGWGRGLHGASAPANRPGPIKREGDGRSPAGVFELGPIYGYAATMEGISLPYHESTATLRCVDDPHSAQYNRIVSTDEVDIDWRSAERMRRDDDLYTVTIVVAHNSVPAQPGAGSCIFLHLWEEAHQGMSGCTAMPMDTLRDLAEWLQPGAAVLVALPRSEYEALKRPWQLPALTPVSQRSR